MSHHYVMGGADHSQAPALIGFPSRPLYIGKVTGDLDTPLVRYGRFGRVEGDDESRQLKTGVQFSLALGTPGRGCLREREVHHIPLTNVHPRSGSA